MDYKFELKNFEGPLDLLLHLVKETKLDIYEVNIREIIEQYLTYINSLKDLNIDIASEYLVMAADLLHLKSKKLVNLKEEEKETETEIISEEDLKNRLIEYEKYKNLMEPLKELENKRMDYYTKLPEDISEFRNKDIKLAGNYSLEDLVKAFLAFKEREKFSRPLTTKITRKELSVIERIDEIRKTLKVKKQISFLNLFADYEKDYVIVTFLAILDMIRSKEITVNQDDNFADIVIESR